MRVQIVSLADFAHKPALEFQQGIAVFALVKRKMLYGSRRSGSAPANGHAAFHCHAQPEFAAGCGRTFQSNAGKFSKGKQKVGIALD